MKRNENIDFSSLSEKSKRQLAILEKYHDIDYENRTIDLELHYKKISDILEDDVSTKNYPKFKRVILQRASEIIDGFPLDFRVNLKLKIDDFEGYSSNEVMESFKDSLEMFHYAVYREKNKNWVLAVIFSVIAAFVLFFRIFASSNEIYASNSIIDEVLDIIAWVFLWEAVTILFLSPGELREISFKLARRIVSITLLDNDRTVLSSIDHNALTSDWVEDSRKESTSKVLLLIAGAASLSGGIATFITTVKDLYDLVISLINGTEIYAFNITVISIAINFVVSLLFIIGGIGAISTFREKGPFKSLFPVMAYTYLILVTLHLAIIVGLAVLFYQAQGTFDVNSLIQGFLSQGVSILYFVSYIFSNISKKKEQTIVKDK